MPAPKARIAALGKVLESGGDLAEKDNAYAKELTAKKAKLDGYRVTARRTWLRWPTPRWCSA